MECLRPVGPTRLRGLDASVGASGPHDFAVRSNISRPRAIDRSRAHKNPPCDPLARKTLPRPPHPVPYVRDDRETPLCVGRDGQSSRGDWGVRKPKYFGKQDWTGSISLIRLNKFAVARKRRSGRYRLQRSTAGEKKVVAAPRLTRKSSAYGSRLALAEPVIGPARGRTRWLTWPGRRQGC